jgi:hypothetical protein
MPNAKKFDDNAVKSLKTAQVKLESIVKEQATRKQWQHMYGWMADYDSKVESDGHRFGQCRISIDFRCFVQGQSESTAAVDKSLFAFLSYGLFR